VAHHPLRPPSPKARNAVAPEHSIKLLPGQTYVLPSGYKIDMVKPDEGRRWRLRGTTAEGVLCHKPCTVSGGGKSEISKSIADAEFTGPVFINDFASDSGLVDSILFREYGHRFRDPARNKTHGRPLLSPNAPSAPSSNSSVGIPTTPTNTTSGSAPSRATSATLVLIIKRFYKPEWGDGLAPSFQCRYDQRPPRQRAEIHREKILTHYLRVGFTPDGSWRTFTSARIFSPPSRSRPRTTSPPPSSCPAPLSPACPPPPKATLR
jgi:hypothetical protein